MITCSQSKVKDIQMNFHYIFNDANMLDFAIFIITFVNKSPNNAIYKVVIKIFDDKFYNKNRFNIKIFFILNVKYVSFC